MNKIVLPVVLALFYLTACGGGTQSPQTEPVTTAAVEADESEPLERFKLEEVTRVTLSEREKQESLPIIDPAEAVQQGEVFKEPEITPDENIIAGITGIFKDFGYSGQLKVPENFKRKVAYYIRFFSTHKKGSRFYARAMKRGEQYLPMIRKVLKTKKLPLSLAYLPVVESGFNPNARSRARAVGMWQFMKGTAKMYGLKINRRVDERRDPEKSTRAAAEYLNDLFAMFGLEDPFLGVCAYNAGEGKILRALRKISYTERGFWTLVRKDLLHNETNEYIPRFMAAVLLARDPAKYASASLTIPAEMAVEVSDAEDREVLNALHSSKDDLGDEKSGTGTSRERNGTHVRPDKMPGPKPGPAGKQQNPQAITSTYIVKKGDTLYSIARKFGTGYKTLKRLNGLRSSRIHPGQKLMLYSPAAGTGGKITDPKTSPGRYRLVYTVNYKDTLARIALYFKGIGTRDIMRWNKLRRTRIYPKQKLTIYLEKPPRKVFTHTVKRGESARIIARKHGLRIEYVLSLNGLVTTSILQPGMKLKIFYF